MRKEQFESMIKELLPTVTDRAMKVWIRSAQAMERDEVELASNIFDATYVELMLVKRDHGENTAVKLFNYGEVFTFNYFELRGAATMLAEGWALERISQFACTYGCDSSEEEFEESQETLRAFKEAIQKADSMQMT